MYIQCESSLVILDSMDPITFHFSMHHLNELDIVFNESIKVSNIIIPSEV